MFVFLYFLQTPVGPMISFLLSLRAPPLRLPYGRAVFKAVSRPPRPPGLPCEVPKTISIWQFLSDCFFRGYLSFLSFIKAFVKEFLPFFKALLRGSYRFDTDLGLLAADVRFTLSFTPQLPKLSKQTLNKCLKQPFKTRFSLQQSLEQPFKTRCSL